jgi:peptidase M1-like protein
MKTIPFVFAVFLSLALQAPAQAPGSSLDPIPLVEHYKLAFVLDPAHHALSADADLRLRNTSKQPIAIVPILLYRLMDVEQVSDSQGKPLTFTENIVKYSDDPVWQVSYTQVKLPAPLAPTETALIHLKYAGQLFGYSEAWAYVHDTISDDYSLIRSETLSYPTVATPSQASRRQSARNSRFDYEIDTTVPEGQIVLCAGDDTAPPTLQNARATFHCQGEPASALSVAAAKFKAFTDPKLGLRVYAMPADAADGGRLLDEMLRSLDFYRSYLGPMQGGRLTIVEIPNGWGSYEASDHIFQSAAAFKDKERTHELWHEISHRWTKVCEFEVCDPLVQRTRYFDEAFAAYFEALAIRQFQGEEAFRKSMEFTRQNFIEDATKDPRGRTTPIADYGRQEIGGFSYTKGTWSLYVLQQLLGEEQFRRSISEFLHAYKGKVSFEDFRRSLEKSSGRNLGPWFQQWILSGPKSSALMFDGKTVDEMAAKCKTE